MSKNQQHSMVTIACFSCGTEADKRLAEINYQQKKFEEAGGIGTRPMFCSRSCGQTYSGELTNYAVQLPRVIANGLWTREKHRYAKISAFLQTCDWVSFKFEYNLPGTRFIFDLALKFGKQKLLVEFDGGYHNYGNALKNDLAKDTAAKRKGWKVLRVAHRKGLKVFSAAAIKEIVV